MSTRPNTAKGTADGAEHPDREGCQGGRQRLWVSEPSEAHITFDKDFPLGDREPLPDIDEYCIIWPESTNIQGTHHASFGHEGTTASVSRYGDMMQVTQYLGEGTSGIFSMDHTKTHEPCLVTNRACDLEDLSETIYGNYSYGLFMTGWPTTEPKIVKWVNWRWPRYEWQTENLKTVFQYYVHEGIVLHQLLFHNISNDEAVDLKHDLRLSGEMRIQDVNHLSRNTHDEQRGELDCAGPFGYGRVKGHANSQVVAVIDVFVDGRRTKIPLGEDLSQLEPLGIGRTRQVVVAYRLSPFPNQRGEPVTWHDFIIPAGKANVGELLRGEVEAMGSRCLDPKILVPPLVGQTTQDTTEQIDATDRDVESKQDGRGEVDMQLQLLHYLTARHLEHILSVCAIPVPSSPNEGLDSAPVSLTCGDMSGHRICTSASYYAFLFLIEIELRLKKVKFDKEDNDSAHMNSLRTRIRKTCKGHIMWLENVWRRANPEPFNSGHFAANLWVTGETQDDWDSDTWQPPNSVTDTAFQILKITGFATTYGDEALSAVQPLLTKVFVAWLHDLDRLDPREKFAWPRPKQDGVDIFRLEDHFWIWKALKAMEDTEMWSKLPKPKRSTAGKRGTKKEDKRWELFKELLGWESTREDPSQLYDKFFLITRRLIPREVQRGVLQRFTTVNDVSGVRALAVHRSSRETRFLLHDRDSAMLYDHDGFKSFFPDESFKALWQQTLKLQKHHPANEESVAGSKWYTVMRYALSVMMGARGSTLNSTKARKALSNSFRTLLKFFSHNGFIGEQLSWLTKEPVIFYDDHDRDSHFHASFEVVYVLLTHAKYVQPMLEERDSNMAGLESDRLAEIVRGLEDISSAFQALPESLATTQRQRVPRLMEESMPFNNHVVSSNVCSIEEEWLYNYPEFFSDPKGEYERSLDSDDKDPCHKKDVDAMIVDVKKQKQYGEPRRRNTVPQNDFILKVLSYEGLKGNLAMARRARDAKKRFIWLPNANHMATEASLPAQDSEAEKQAVSLFFNRHFQCEKLVEDETSLALNAWNSELHLSFQCLVGQDEPVELDRNRQCRSNHEKEVYCVLSADDVEFPQPQSRKTKLLRRASMSYRFNGDLFDRYWTCHFIESCPVQHEDDSLDASSLASPSSSYPSPSSSLSSNHGTTYTCLSPTPGFSECGKCGPCLFLSKDDRKSAFAILNEDKRGFKTWWQRKVLELLLLQRMLEKVFRNTGSVLKEIEKSELKEEEEKKLPHWKLEMTRNSWLQLVDTLGIIEDDLTSTLETLRTWDDRAKNHGVEKPRWTLNDENKYRGSIRKEQTSTNKLRSRIQKQKQTAMRLQKNFKEAARRLQMRLKEEQKAKSENEEKKRAAREQQSERNIRWFTYVTIVFAPLSFAEGFYSMGGAPPYELTRSLVTFSAVALFITVVLLFGAIKTFSALKKKRESMESDSNGRSRKVSPVSKEKDESKESGSDGQSLPSLWMLLVSTVLDHMVRAMLYPMRVWEQGDGKIPAKALLSLMLGFALGIIISPVFIFLWLLQFSLLNIRDLYRWFKQQLYMPPRKESEPRKDEEARSPRDQLGHPAIHPPRLLERFLKK